MKALGVPIGKKLLYIAATISTIFAQHAWSEESTGDSNLQFSGFFTAIGGKTFSGASNAGYIGPTLIDGHAAPGAYVADWANAGVYTNDFSLEPESRVGVQANYKFNDKTSFVGQVVSRGSDPTPNVQWAYGSYKINQNWEVQIGRKRIPLYYYSDFQDVGVSYPWISPPPELYGWEVTNYNGGSLRYNGNVGETDITANVFAGKEKVNNSLYERLYYSGKTKVTWDNIVGGDLEAGNGPLTVRGIYLQANENLINLGASLNDYDSIKAYGVAINLDFSKWFMLSEFTQLTRNYAIDQYTVRAPALTIGTGLRLGKWTPLVNYAKYTEHSSDLSQYQPQCYRRSSFTLRYDIDTNSDVKAQVDHQTDATNNFGGNSNIFRIGYDRSF